MKKDQGFSLLELVITVGLIAVLLTLAIPSYRDYVIRANRTAAIEAIMTAAACEERIYSRTGAYIYDNTCKTTPKGYNQLNIANLNTGQGFRIIAVPNGSQATDKCKNLRLDHTGRKSLAGGPTKTVDQCWGGR